MREYNIVKKKIGKNTIRVAIVYPSTYEAMLSSLAIHIIYYLLNYKFEKIYAERFYLRNIFGPEPPARSLETGSPLKDFDLIITSIHYEPMIAGLIKMLHYSGLPPISEERNIPIIAGGPGLMANPFPYKKFIDVFIIGEIESTLPPIINSFMEYPSKDHFLEAVSKYDFTYVPKFDDDKEIHKSWIKDLDNAFYPVRQIQSEDVEPVYGRGFLLEVSRGCKYWCRFCIESRLFKPYRRRSLHKLVKLVDQGVEANNVSRVILFSLLFPGEKDDRNLIEYLISNNVKATLPSMRLELLDDDFLELLRLTGQKQITTAPESFNTFTQRILGKYFDLDLVNEKLYEIIDKGFDLKLYIIFGLRNEKIEENKRNVENIRRLAVYAKRRGRKISVTLNPLVPKPKTVFQWIGMIELPRAKNILRYYIRELRGLIDTRPLYINWAWIQASIGLAKDNDIWSVLLDWSIRGGDLGSWRRAIRNYNYDTRYVFRGYSINDSLPWDRIILGNHVEKVLLKEYEILKKLMF